MKRNGIIYENEFSPFQRTHRSENEILFISPADPFAAAAAIISHHNRYIIVLFYIHCSKLTHVKLVFLLLFAFLSSSLNTNVQFNL